MKKNTKHYPIRILMACSPGIHPEYTVNLETAKKNS